MNTAPELVVYIKPGCPWCIGVTSYLHNEGYEFTEIDVYASDKAYDEMKRLSGQTFAPTVVYEELILADCGVEELKRFLKEHDLQPNAT